MTWWQILLSVWLVPAAIFAVVTADRSLFSAETFRHKWVDLEGHVLFSILWPLWLVLALITYFGGEY